MNSKTNQRKLQKLQNVALRFAFNEKFRYRYKTEKLHKIAEKERNNINMYYYRKSNNHMDETDEHARPKPHMFY